MSHTMVIENLIADTACRTASAKTEPGAFATNRLKRLVMPPSEFLLVDREHRERAGLEAHIAERFHREYGANLYHFLDSFVVMKCCQRTSAIAGVNLGSNKPFFFEQYLQQPVEEILTNIQGTSCQRHEIAEIGNLVGAHRGASQLMFLVLADSLRKAGVRWFVFTATGQIGKLLDKLHCHKFDLGSADPKLLGEKIEQWGSYYSTNPHIFAIDLDSALIHARTNLTQSIVLHMYSSISSSLSKLFSPLLGALITTSSGNVAGNLSQGSTEISSGVEVH